MGKPKSRGNHTGSVYKRKNTGTWTAQIVVGWKQSQDGSKLIPIKKTFGGFQTKKEALEALSRLTVSYASETITFTTTTH